MVEVTGIGATEKMTTRLGRVLDASRDEVFLVDPVTLAVVYANRGARDALGLAAAEPQGLTLPQIMTDYSAESLAATLQPLVDGATDQLLLCSSRPCGDGASCPVEMLVQLNDAEDPPLLIAIAASMAERRVMEDQLRRSNRAMTALTRATEAMIHATDTQELLEEVCRIVVEVGCYRLAWIGCALQDTAKLVQPVAQWGIGGDYVRSARISWSEHDERGRGPTGTAIRTRQPQVARHTAKEGRFSPWREVAVRHGFGSTIALPLVTGDQVTGVLNIYATEPDAFDCHEVQLLEDLARNLSYGLGALRTELKRRLAERELKESEERYRVLVELSPDAIVTHSDGVIVFANAAAHDVFRVPAATSLVGRRILDFVHPDERAAVARRIATGDLLPRLMEERLLRFDGETFFAEVAVTNIALHGERTRLVVVRDATERRQVRDQLIQAAKLATLGEMAAGMAHELSQPLNVIRMAAEGALMLIQRNRASEDYKTTQFELIADQTRRMAEIIDHIRIFSRKDSGAVEVFDAATAVGLAVELFERQLRGDDVALGVSLPATPCPTVGRPVQLEQVVMNLLANAADAVREKARSGGDPDFHGKLSVVTTCSEDLGLIWIAVSDNGTGIPPHALERMFEPFFTTKEIGRGTGLGLSVSFGIIAAMSGRLDACNNQEGASFVITLPLSPAVPDAESQAQPAPDRLAAPEAGRHLLVVDDEPDAVAAMALYLREYGYRVTTASDGVEAWSLFQADPADLVVTDLRMPNGDGGELVRRLRQHDPLLPIIVVTGHMGTTESLGGDEEDELAVIMKKPVSLQALAETVEQFLDS